MTTHVKVETPESVVSLAYDRVLKTRTDVILTNRFYGVLVSNVDPVVSRAFPTAATNGKQHFFNPEFVLKLTAKELKFVQRHESEHDARHHSTRRGGRDPKEWNIAGDYAINIDLVDEIAAGDTTMEVPRAEVLGGKPYIDAKYRGMAAEDIFRCRELDRQQAEQEKAKQQPQPQEGDGEADDEDDANQEEAGNDEADTEPGDEAGDDDGDDAGDEPGEEAGDETGEGTGEGDGEGDEGGEPSSVTGDMPGGMGEVLDATDDPTDLAGNSEEEAKWERVVRQAATIGKGDMPGHMVREIDRANQPKQDWREVLRAYFDQGATQIETWNRPNRRFVGAGTILPGSQREGVNEVAILIDTSGSVDDVALAAVAAETQAALDEGVINKLHLVFGDVQVTATAEYTPGDVIDFTAKGRGGTAMRPLFDWVRENIDSPSLVVCFTDLFIEPEAQLGEQPACPVLWAVHGYPQAVRELIAKAPWGEPGIDVALIDRDAIWRDEPGHVMTRQDDEH